MPRRKREEGEIRIRRLQRSRRCKKIRFDFESNLRLQDLPEDVIREILQYSQPKRFFEEEGWKFISQIGAVCSGFYRVSKQLSTPPLRVPPHELGPRRRSDAFLRSFIDCPSKALSVKHLAVDFSDDLYVGYYYAATTSVRSFLLSPGLLNVTRLDLRSFELYAGNLHSNIIQLCQNLPKLAELELEGYAAPRLPPFSVQQFSSFASSLPRTLRKLYICGTLFTKAQIIELVRQCGSELKKLQIFHRYNVTEDDILDDDTLLSIAQHCPQLVELGIPGFNISNGGMESYLRANGASLVNLGLSEGRNLTAEVIHHLVKYAPCLKELFARGCTWFDDEALETLVQGQLDRMRQTGADNQIPLKCVAANDCPITATGARRIVSKDGVGKLTICGPGIITSLACWQICARSWPFY